MGTQYVKRRKQSIAFDPNLQTDLRDVKAQGANVGDTRSYNGANYRWSGVNWEQSGGGSSGNSITNNSSFEDTVKRAIELQKTAAQPAIDTLQSNIPTIQSNYASQKADVTAKEQTLKDRYDALLKTIGTSESAETSRQATTTNNELASRGILSGSGIYGQTMTNALNPITSKYVNLKSTTNADETSGLQDLASLITQLTTGESSDIMGVNNAIAQLKSGAATSGITTGTNLYSSNQATLAAQAAQTYKKEQDKIANALNEKKANKPIELASTGGYLYDPVTGKITKIGGGLGGSGKYYGNGNTNAVTTDNKLILPSQYNQNWLTPPPGFGYNSSGQLLPL